MPTRLGPSNDDMFPFIYAGEIDFGESVRGERESWPPTDEEKSLLESVRAHREARARAAEEGADEGERTQFFRS